MSTHFSFCFFMCVCMHKLCVCVCTCVFAGVSCKQCSVAPLKNDLQLHEHGEATRTPQQLPCQFSQKSFEQMFPGQGLSIDLTPNPTAPPPLNSPLGGHSAQFLQRNNNKTHTTTKRGPVCYRHACVEELRFTVHLNAEWDSNHCALHQPVQHHIVVR